MYRHIADPDPGDGAYAVFYKIPAANGELFLAAGLGGLTSLAMGDKIVYGIPSGDVIDVLVDADETLGREYRRRQAVVKLETSLDTLIEQIILEESNEAESTQ
jgi:hypothetical protein